jgi:hypothetical protein
MHLGKWVVAAVLAASLVALRGEAAGAPRGKKGAAKLRPAPKKMSEVARMILRQKRAVDLGLIHDLEATEELLEAANADDKGRRTAAIRQVRRSVKQLRLGISRRARVNDLNGVASPPAGPGNAGEGPAGRWVTSLPSWGGSTTCPPPRGRRAPPATSGTPSTS